MRFSKNTRNTIIGIALSLIRPITTPSLGQPQSQEFLTWTDPQGDFSIDYPSMWRNLTERENRFDTFDIIFNPVNSTNSSIIRVFVDYHDPRSEAPEAHDMLIELGMNESEILERGFDKYIESFGSGVNDFREVDDREFSKYTVDGEPAASVIFAGERDNGQEFGGLLVIAFVNDRFLDFMFRSGQDEFDGLLPIVEHMISSIHIPTVI